MHRRISDGDPLPSGEISDLDWLVGCVLAFFQIVGVIIVSFLIYQVGLYLYHLCYYVSFFAVKGTIGFCQ